MVFIPNHFSREYVALIMVGAIAYGFAMGFVLGYVNQGVPK